MTATREALARTTTDVEYGVQTASGVVLVVTENRYDAYDAARWVMGGQVVERFVTHTQWRLSTTTGELSGA